MQGSGEALRELLKTSGIRVTAPRLAVLRVLSQAERPLSHTEVLERLGAIDCDPATVYRSLIKLRDAGLAVVASRVAGIDRYDLARATGSAHGHPHFLCEDCGRVACLPDAVQINTAAAGPWAVAVDGAALQLLCTCPDCLEGGATGAPG